MCGSVTEISDVKVTKLIAQTSCHQDTARLGLHYSRKSGEAAVVVSFHSTWQCLKL